MYLGKDDVAVLLIREGLARVDEYAAERGSKDLVDAQEEAKRAKKNVRSLPSPLLTFQL
jgi:staphylococcal nuclease domain-containing protein 1